MRNQRFEIPREIRFRGPHVVHSTITAAKRALIGARTRWRSVGQQDEMEKNGRGSIGARERKRERKSLLVPEEKRTRAEQETRFFFPAYFLAYRPLSRHEETKESYRTSFVLFNFTSRTKTGDKRRTTEIEARCSGNPSRCQGNTVFGYKEESNGWESEERSEARERIDRLWSRGSPPKKTKEERSFVAIVGSITTGVVEKDHWEN